MKVKEEILLVGEMDNHLEKLHQGGKCHLHKDYLVDLN